MSLAALVAAVLAPPQFSAAGTAYKCYVSDGLYYGLVPGEVQATGAVDCSGYGGAGSVKFTIRLQRYDAQAKSWNTVKSKSRRYRQLSRKHHFDLLSPCMPTKYRASYVAVLHKAGGVRVSTNSQKLGPITVQVPCVSTIGGPPTNLLHERAT